MNKIRLIVYLFLFSLCCTGQIVCETEFVKDTMYLPKEQKVVDGEYVQTTLKKLSEVRFFKTTENKFYLKFVVTENFYFDKVAVLELKSGSKSYYAKDTRQYKINKHKGLFVIEVFKNYLATLKEDGITSIVFSQAETDFTRQDASQIKKIARCFYEATFGKK